MLAGAVGGACAAAGDFGASWLWLEGTGTRLELAARLLATLPAAGALGGAALAALYATARAICERIAWCPERRRAALTAVLVTLPAVPLLAWAAASSLSGPRARALPAHGVLVVAATALLWAAAALALATARRAVQRAQRDRRSAAMFALIALAIHVALGKLDQWLLPGLYPAMHALLSVASVAAGALFALCAACWLPRRSRRLAVAATATLALTAGAFVAHAWTLSSSPGIAVALFDPRAATSRSLSLAVGPLLARARAAERDLERVHLERARRREQLRTGELPVWRGAHLLLLTIDALRADHLGAYGYARPTSPALDALATRAVLFERAYAQAPHSSHSLASLMTGEYVHELVALDRPLPSATLATALAAAGYRTEGYFITGVFYTDGDRLAPYRDGRFGFAVHDGRDEPAEARTDRVLAAFERLRAEGEPPTLLWAHYFDVHEPYTETTFGTSPIDRYDGDILRTDRAIGRLLRELPGRLSRDLIVVVTADHGEEFREHGGVYHGTSVYDEQVRVPLLIVAPDLPPRRVHAPVELVDLAPTLLGMLGVPVPPSMRGDDLRALALGRLDDAGPAFASVRSTRMVVAWPYKLITDLRLGLVSLFDLAADPRERRNLARDRPEVVRRLETELAAWLDAMRKAPDAPAETSPVERLLDRARLGDRSTVPELLEVARDRTTPRARRLSVVQHLGRLSDARTAGPILRELRTDPDATIAAEATVSLGMLGERGMLEPLVALARDGPSPELRRRAAVALGRMRDVRAVEPLLEALAHEPAETEREWIVRLLGWLRDPRATPALLEELADPRLRHVVAIALGDIGDVRALEPLVAALTVETNATSRDALARALGQLGDRRAIGPLLDVAAADDAPPTASESLVRLGAIERGDVGGADVGPETHGATGL
ncbi:MAG: sulfatase-like hydrolase/transferase, partial [Myxococcota bacterium]|nr:sulfatase-like hydrolase/transferase [Myxococcota bacterium]